LQTKFFHSLSVYERYDRKFLLAVKKDEHRIERDLTERFSAQAYTSQQLIFWGKPKGSMLGGMN